MAHKQPLVKIKDLALDSLKASLGLARSAANVARSTAGRAVKGVSLLVGGRIAPTETSGGEESPADRPEPVNVVEALGLDPTPVGKTSSPKPATSIDAAADPDAVSATPADVARAVRRDSDSEE